MSVERARRLGRDRDDPVGEMLGSDDRDSPARSPAGYGAAHAPRSSSSVLSTLDALDHATAAFARSLAIVPIDGWSMPTPCDEWDVHYLAAHVVGGNRFAEQILGGASARAAIEHIMSAAQLGNDPVAAFATTCDVQRRAFRATGALTGPVDHPLGTMNGLRFLDFRVFDIALHAWDLAAAIDADSTLDPELVDVVSAIVSSGDLGFGITPLGAVGNDASPLARLLDLTGRREH
jgi:uncharacterized protein (TIGR03086 family)